MFRRPRFPFVFFVDFAVLFFYNENTFGAPADLYRRLTFHGITSGQKNCYHLPDRRSGGTWYFRPPDHEPGLSAGADRSAKTYTTQFFYHRRARQFLPRHLLEKKRCFCQMCKKVKQHGYIEVNNIEANPGFFFPELRISLCLECSKYFISQRNKKTSERHLSTL